MTSLAIEIIPADSLPKGLKDLLAQAYQREFSWDKMIYAEPEWFVIGTLDQKLAGQVGILQRDISVDGKLMRIGGIHGVVTEPEHRHRGVASLLMARAVDFIQHELNLPFGLLTCQPRLEAYYNRLGWKTTKEPCVFEQPEGPRSCGGLTMVIECGSKPWPEGQIDLRGLPW
jgi:aminoglycoside 2'-N-acetyltransferase I